MTNIGNIWGHIPKSQEEVFHRAEGCLEEEQYERLADYVTRPEHLIVQMHTLLSRSMAITSGQRQALEYLLMFVDSSIPKHKATTDRQRNQIHYVTS